MKNNTVVRSDYHCTVMEQKHLVSEMTKCDNTLKSYDKKYECYLEATKESRENKACMFS